MANENSDLLQSLLNSYVNAHETDEGNLEELRRYIRNKGLGDRSVDELRQQIQGIRQSRQAAMQRPQQLAELFTSENEVRDYRFGSPFCPNCNLFKNYEKECPFCSYLELSL